MNPLASPRLSKDFPLTVICDTRMYVTTSDGQKISFDYETVDWAALIDSVVIWERLCDEARKPIVSNES